MAFWSAAGVRVLINVGRLGLNGFDPRNDLVLGGVRLGMAV